MSEYLQNLKLGINKILERNFVPFQHYFTHRQTLPAETIESWIGREEEEETRKTKLTKST